MSTTATPAPGAELGTIECPRCHARLVPTPLIVFPHLRAFGQRLDEWERAGALPTETAESARTNLTALLELEPAIHRIVFGAAGEPATAAAGASGAPRGLRPGASGADRAVAEGLAAGAIPGAAVAAPSPVERAARSLVAGAGAATGLGPLVALLSERTLNALLGLGALLVLVSGVVISTLNPTGLPPAIHFGAILATALLFMAGGWATRARLDLPRTGDGLLAIGAAFVPLAAGTLTGPGLLDLSEPVRWLAASAVALPLWLGLHLRLHDRPLAWLSPLAGGALVVSATSLVGLPAEWQVVALVAAAVGLLAGLPRLRALSADLVVACRWLAEGVLLLGTLGFGLDTLLPRPGEPADYVARTLAPAAVMWWLASIGWLIRARQTERAGYRRLAAVTVVLAVVGTLHLAAPLRTAEPLPLALLSLAVLAAGRRLGPAWGGAFAEDTEGAARAWLLQPVYAVAAALWGVSFAWAVTFSNEQVPAVAVLAATALLATRLFPFLALRWAGAVSLAYLASAAFNQLALTVGEPLREWRGAALAATALAYLGYRAVRVGVGGDAGRHPRTLLAEPVYPIAALLGLAAVLAPTGRWASAVTADLLVAVAAAVAALLVGRARVAWLGGACLLAAAYRLLPQLAPDAGSQAQLWTLLGLGCLAGADELLRRTGETTRSTRRLLLAEGAWRALLAPALAVTGGIDLAAGVVPALGAGLGIVPPPAIPAGSPSELLVTALRSTLLPWWLLGGLAVGLALRSRQARALGPAWAVLLVAYLVTARVLQAGLGLPAHNPGLWLVPAVWGLWLAEWRGDRTGRGAAPAGSPAGSGSLLHGLGWVTLGLAFLSTLNDPAAGAIVALGLVPLIAWSAQRHNSAGERVAAVVVGGLGSLQLLRALGVPPLQQPPLWTTGALVLAAGAVGLYVRGGERWRGWVRPLEVAGLVVALAAVPIAVGGWLLDAFFALLGSSTRLALETASLTLLASGLTLMTAAWLRGRRLRGYGGLALLLAAAWLRLGGNGVEQPQAYVLPAGAYLLLLAYLETRLTARHELKPLFEIAAAALCLGTTALQALGVAPAPLDRAGWCAVLLFESLAVFGLGASLRWRRLFLGGIAGVGLDLLILLIEPLRALNTWYLVAVVGLGLLALVWTIEQRRQQLRAWLGVWSQRLEAWE